MNPSNSTLSAAGNSNNTGTSTGTDQTLLVELLTEELPPKALNALGEAFANGIYQALQKNHLLENASQCQGFATPRRLAVLITHVREQAPEQSFTAKLMPAPIGLTPSGEASPALLKKLASLKLSHLTVADLVREPDGKHDYLYARGTSAGARLNTALQEALDHTLSHLPIPKVMQYQLADGKTSVRFVRPAHRLTAVLGSTVVPVQALGLSAGNTLEGHRFMGEKTLRLDTAASYENLLLERGKVVASFAARKEKIRQALQAEAEGLGASLGDDPEVLQLLDEVTALVEYPTVYVGQFDPQFLEVPPECLILTMRQNQRYFPLFNPANGQLTHRFLIVSNMRPDDPGNIIEGNERVVRPRLADARFFFETDRKQTLESRINALAGSVYHNKLGNQLERSQRIAKIATHLAEQLKADARLADRAARLAKADLNTSMVAEFPELQGIIGAYYAQADNENPAVVHALRSQYQLRLNQPVSADTLIAAIVFMAERLETLVGIWGIGLSPTGERDPFGLRRAALGLISAWQQLQAGGWLTIPDSSTLALAPLLELTASTFEPEVIAPDTVAAVQAFIYERYRNLLGNEYDKNVIDAVLALQPPLHEVTARIDACRRFAQSPQAASLAAANKRIGNLLRRAETTLAEPDPALFTDTAEHQLYQAIKSLEPQARAQYAKGDFSASLATLARARDAVDTFFNDVMIMADDDRVRTNRLALLQRLHQAMNQVADLARLA